MDRKVDFMLDDEFERTGRWWLPENPEDQLHGTLRYSQSQIELELSGTFDDVSATELLGGSAEFKNHPCIHGVSHDRQKFTLLRAHATSLASTTKYSAFHLIVDKHVPSLPDLKLRAVSFYCSHLEAFIGRQLFAVENEGEKEDFKSLTVKYIQPPKLAWRIDEINATVDFQTGMNWISSHTPQRHELRAKSFVTITPDAQEPLDWFIKQIWRFCYLLTLVTDEVVSPTGVEVFLDGDKYPGWHLYQVSKERDKDADKSTPVFLFHLAHLVDNFEPILRQWFSVDDTLLNSIHLTMDAQRNPDHSVQGRFLLLAHAVEVISRATTSSEYMSNSDYESVKNDLVAAIPSRVGSDHRASLKNKIKYGNEYSFHKRVKLLIESLPASAQDVVCRDPVAFARGVSETRNYYTHFTDELRPKALPPVPLYWASEKLSFLMRIVLLRYLNIPVELTVERMKEHHRLLQRIFYSKEHPECLASK